MSDRSDFKVGFGATFKPTIRWGTSEIVSKAITGISLAAPAVVTSVAHGVVDGWPVAVVSAKGMAEINAKNFPPRGNDWHQATVLTNDSVQIDDVNSADMSAYTSGGFLVYATPVDLSAITAAEMNVLDSPDDGAVLVTLTLGAGITLDNVAKTIVPTFETEGVDWTVGYCDLNLTDSSGKVTQLLTGTITII
jgi:hypothetical protein